MNQTKFRSITLGALILVLAFLLSLAFGALAPMKVASADYNPTSIFSASSSGRVGESGGDQSYVQFTLTSEGTVSYRRDLALKWFEPAETDSKTEGFTSNSAEIGYYSMTISFPAIHFEKMSISYESAEENISKESTATNSIVFFRDGEAVSAAIRNASEQPDEAADEEEEDDWTPEKVTIDASGDLEITFDEENCNIGEFAVYINGTLIGKMTNIGGNYFEYLSSASSTPRVPVTFSVDELSSDATEQLVLMKEINGQSFLLKDGQIVDDTAPVLVINEEVYAYTLGRKWSLTYEAIDVCDSSVTVTRRYFMMKAPEDGVYQKPVGKDYSALTTSTFFMPTSDAESEQQYVSIYFELDDGRTLTTAEKEEERVYLAWYTANSEADEVEVKEHVCSVCGYVYNGTDAFEDLADDWNCPSCSDDGATTGASSFEERAAKLQVISVDRDKYGPTYVGVTADEDTKQNVSSDEAARLAAEYQQAIDDLTVEYDSNGNRKLKLSAGDGAYFYLPSLRGLIASDYADYRNLRFNIYYKKQSLEAGSGASSQTSLRYNALRFEIDEEGKYVFKVLASDNAGNAMQYYVDGKLVDVSSSNIWDIEEIPEFTFEVTYTGATIEKPGEQSLGYKGNSYTIDSFDIVALDGYEADYTLFEFDIEKASSNSLRIPTYSEFVKNAEREFERLKDAFVEIRKYNSDITEDDDRWYRTDNDYHWNPDSALSFTPQKAGQQQYYVVRLTVTEARMPGHAVTAYEVINVQSPIDPLPDPTYWLENNIVSVVLFSISAVLLIAIVILFVSKPSEKKVEEVDLESLKGGKKRKNNK